MLKSITHPGAPSRFAHSLAAIATVASLVFASASAVAQTAAAPEHADELVALAALIQASDSIAFSQTAQSIGMAVPSEMAFALARAYRDEGFRVVETGENSGVFCLGRAGRCDVAASEALGDGVADGVLVPAVNLERAYKIEASVAIGDPGLLSAANESPQNELSRKDHGARIDEAARAHAIDAFLAASAASEIAVQTTGNDDPRFDGQAGADRARAAIAQRYAKLGGYVTEAEFAPGRLTLAFRRHGCATESMGASMQAALNGDIEPTARCVSVSSQAYDAEVAAIPTARPL